MKFLLTFCCVLVLLISGHGSAVACTEYKQAQVRNGQQLASMDFGILAFKVYSSRNRYLTFEEAGCYDLTDLTHGSHLNLYVNNRSDEIETTYLAASVVRTFPIPMRGVPQVSVEFYRNANDKNTIGKWIRADDEANYLEGSSIIGKRFDIIPGDYTSTGPAAVDSPAKLESLDLASGLSEMASWHALIADVDGTTPARSLLYHVVKNTRVAIEFIRGGVRQIDSGEFPTLLAKFYLIKFSSSPAPSLAAPALKIGWATCIYLNYRIGGATEPPFRISGSTDQLTFRTVKGADC